MKDGRTLIRNSERWSEGLFAVWIHQHRQRHQWNCGGRPLCGPLA